MSKKKVKEPGDVGRPHVVLDQDKIGQLAFAGCKNSEIAHILGCDDQTLTRNYSPLLAQKRAERRAALRGKQTKEALEGNSTMLVWLGKNDLDQADSQHVEHTGPNNGPVIFQMPRPAKK